MVKCDEDDFDFRAIFDGYLDTYPPYIIVRYNIVNSVGDIESELHSFTLYQNYPNPFNPSTKISWQVLAGCWQTLKIYDALGNEVTTLVDGYRQAGTYEVEWNTAGLPSGVYFYQLKTEGFVDTKKMIFMK
jgi:hypothetical protein